MEELFIYYPNLLIVEYNGKKKAKQTIELFTYLMFCNLIFQQIQNAFDWKTATGKQLDIIGKWVGVSRSYQGNNFWGSTFFSYPETNRLVPSDNTDTLQHGYSDYATFNSDTGNVLTYNDLGFVEQSLSDDDFRTIIGLKIIKNSINHTAKDIDSAVWNYFGGQTFYSNQSIGIGTTLYTDEALTNAYGDIYSLTDGVTVIKNATVTSNLNNWTSGINADFTGTNIIYANNIFISLGAGSGKIKTSTDGNTWSTINLGTGVWRGLTYGNKFVAVGADGITSSVDGNNWTTPVEIHSKSWAHVTYGNGKYVATSGSGGYVTTSSDGINWTVPVQVDSNSFTNVYFGNNKFIATNSLYNYNWISDDGISWQKYSYASVFGGTLENITGFAAGNNSYVMVGAFGGIYYSSDCINWQSVYKDYTYRWRNVFFVNNMFIVTSMTDSNHTTGAFVTSSSNGISWDIPNQIFNADGIHSIGYGAFKYIAIYYTTGQASKISVSNDVVSFDSSNFIKGFYNNSINIKNIYTIGIGNVYTSWNSHQLTYHYPADMDTVMNVCEYKNVLPAPTGVKIILSQIS